MSKLFFIIPVYNVEKYLERCISSVLNQSYKNIHIILVDDGSPDRCPEICDEYAKMHDNITVIHKKNGGLSDARNAALNVLCDMADADDYLTFLDSDDFVDKYYAEKMLALCREYSCDIVQCGYEKGSGEAFSGNKSDFNISKTEKRDALTGYRLKSQCCAKVYRMKTFFGVRFPKGVINEDEFVTYRAVYNSESVVFTDEELYYYYQHSTSIMDNVAKKLKNNPHRYDFLKAYAERIQFFEERNEPEQVLKTKEKICTDMILRYSEQMYIDKNDRDEDCTNGKYMKIYRENFWQMIKRKGIPLKRRLMYISFYILPYSAVIMGKIFTLRK